MPKNAWEPPVFRSQLPTVTRYWRVFAIMSVVLVVVGVGAGIALYRVTELQNVAQSRKTVNDRQDTKIAELANQMKASGIDPSLVKRVENLKGDKGNPGAAGTPGIPGPQGPAGPKGDKGDKGDPGIQGASGPVGKNGTNGPQGSPGPAGASGQNGTDGTTPGCLFQPNKCQGAVGVAGPAGPQGPQGDPGVQGPAGEQGPKGDPGTNGADGLDGQDGTNGKDGRGIAHTQLENDGLQCHFHITYTDGTEEDTNTFTCVP